MCLWMRGLLLEPIWIVSERYLWVGMSDLCRVNISLPGTLPAATLSATFSTAGAAASPGLRPKLNDVALLECFGRR